MKELIPKISVLLLIFVRVSAFFVTIPLFSYRTIPSSIENSTCICFILDDVLYVFN